MINCFGKIVYISGICGISMSAIAKYLKSEGLVVCGSDLVNDGDVYNELYSLGIQVYSQTPTSLQNVNPDCYIYSVAIKSDNPEFVLAKKMNIKMYNRAQALALISNLYKTKIFIAGSHGKSTTTALISSLFNYISYRPTCFIGANLTELNTNVIINKRSIFVAEACEYFDSFLQFYSTISVILNIQADHLDYFNNMQNLKKSFLQFANNTSLNGFVILNADDNNCLQIAKTLTNHKIISFGLKNKNADVLAFNIKRVDYGFVFDVCIFNKTIKNIYLPLPLKHNVYNALATIIVAYLLDVSEDNIKFAIKNFKGISRRYEKWGDINGAKVICDYAHHPTEIKKLLQNERKITKGNINVVFQPHTYSRTKTLFNDFCNCFKNADSLILFKEYPARENPCIGKTSFQLYLKIKEKQKTKYFKDYKLLTKYLQNNLKFNDCLLVVGAGDIIKLKDYLFIQK